jgi:hypothetical protein
MGIIVYPESVKLKPTNYAKSLLSKKLYFKGKNFVEAAILLRCHQGDEYVVLQLLCQGIEIILKALLLLKNYDFYTPLMKSEYSGGFGHNLVRLSSEVLQLYGLKSLQPAIVVELQELNNLYSKHIMRYYSPCDILIDPNIVKSNFVLKRILAAIRLIDTKIK